MKKNLLLGITLALAGLGAAQSAPPRPLINSSSSDAPPRAHRPNLPNMTDASLSPPNADVGDGDSFGRSVNFLGFTQVDGVGVWNDCTGQPEGHCVVREENGSNSISFIGDDAVVKLPARSAHSVLCFTLTHLGEVVFHNGTDSPQLGEAQIGAQWRIESEVLNDPALIDPATGAPYGGSMRSSALLYLEDQTLAPHFDGFNLPTSSRSCISGHLSRRSLVAQGLSEAQAREFFRKPITIRFGASARGSFADVWSSYGVRIYGD